MSTNHFLLCKACGQYADVAQGTDETPWLTVEPEQLLSFLHKHAAHHLTFINEHDEQLFNAEEVYLE